MLIRPATFDDIPQLISIATQSETAAHWTEAQYRAVLVDVHPRRVLLVAEDGGGLSGFVVGAEIAGEWELENIVVTGSAQGRGLGTKLLQCLLEKVRESGGQSVFLEVRESNRPARTLYEKAGFIEAGMRRGYYHHPPENAVLYKKVVF